VAEVFHNFIGGHKTECKSMNTFPNVNPANTDEIVGLFQASGIDDVAEACNAAVQAKSAWASTPAPLRGEYLFRAADLVERRLAQLAEEMTREAGKTLTESKGEIKRTINILRYFGGEGARLFGFQIPSERPGVFCYTLRKPLGVVGLITPWNFPSAIPAWKIAPALVSGNAVVIKPSEKAPLSVWRLVAVPHEVGSPAGVINCVTGTGTGAGIPLVDNSAIRAVSFTGSCAVGNNLRQRVANKKVRVQLEMGGKNPTIILKDADLDYAAEVLVNGAFFSAGQKCTACSRAIIEKSVYEPLLEKLIKKTRNLKVGNGLEPGIHMGPLIDQDQLEKVLGYIQTAKNEGARLLIGGNRMAGGAYDKGYFVEPAIFADVSAGMRIAQEEIFGPVLALMIVDDFEEAIRVANGVQFGLSASIVSRDLALVHQFINQIEAGLITVNLPTAGVEYQLPFGGTKESSFGIREQGPAAIDFYTETGTVYMKYKQG
jgi:aldehyde dehydrogenase (NAD+)